MCHHYLGYGGGAGANPGDETPGKRRPAGCGDPRNPFLLKYMENLRYVDRLGRGFPMIISADEKPGGQRTGAGIKGQGILVDPLPAKRGSRSPGPLARSLGEVSHPFPAENIQQQVAPG